MRVIAGSAKGTKLAKVPDGTRPMTDRAREGLFSSLAPDLPGARVLDLYAGTGAVGVEALSRGAAAAVFVDRATGPAKAIAENLRRTKLEDRARVVRAEVLTFLRGEAEPFGAVFLDAPYDLAEELDQVFDLLRGGWLAPDRAWTVMLSRAPKGYTPVTPLEWVAQKRLNYGDTLITLYREV
ncbi:MAG: RsmD family RNA methyltransferase [Actinomycetota bacterium]